MECKDIIPVLSKYQDAELDKELSENVKKHLKECKACREEFRLLEKTLFFIKEQPEVEAADNFTAITMGLLHNENKKRFFPLPAFIYSFVFVLFFFLGIFINFSPENTEVRNKAIESVSELLLNSQELSFLNVRNSSFFDLLGVEYEKRMD